MEGVEGGQGLLLKELGEPWRVVMMMQALWPVPVVVCSLEVEEVQMEEVPQTSVCFHPEAILLEGEGHMPA